MTLKTATETTELTPDDEAFAKLNRAKALVLKSCQLADLEADEAMNVIANVLVMLAVHGCLPREDLLAAMGAMYDARLKHDMEDETLN